MINRTYDIVVAYRKYKTILQLLIQSIILKSNLAGINENEDILKKVPYLLKNCYLVNILEKVSVFLKNEFIFELFICLRIIKVLVERSRWNHICRSYNSS